MCIPPASATIFHLCMLFDSCLNPSCVTSCVRWYRRYSFSKRTKEQGIHISLRRFSDMCIPPASETTFHLCMLFDCCLSQMISTRFPWAREDKTVKNEEDTDSSALTQWYLFHPESANNLPPSRVLWKKKPLAREVSVICVSPAYHLYQCEVSNFSRTLSFYSQSREPSKIITWPNFQQFPTFSVRLDKVKSTVFKGLTENKTTICSLLSRHF